MESISRVAPPRCQGCAEQIAALEHRIAEMEKFFATLQAPAPSPLSARQKATERWHPAAS